MSCRLDKNSGMLNEITVIFVPGVTMDETDSYASKEPRQQQRNNLTNIFTAFMHHILERRRYPGTPQLGGQCCSPQACRFKGKGGVTIRWEAVI
jgi:hypothetical protein